MYGEEHVCGVALGGLPGDLPAGVDEEVFPEVPVMHCLGEGPHPALQGDARPQWGSN